MSMANYQQHFYIHVSQEDFTRDLEPHDFLDRFADREYYFDWQKPFDPIWALFTNRKLKGQTYICWRGMEDQMIRRG